jgi:glycosyltransferase involved in cell wall biosynthesis
VLWRNRQQVWQSIMDSLCLAGTSDGSSASVTGRYAQFLNFQECFPEDRAQGAHWIGRARSTRDPVRILMVGGEFLRKGAGMLLDWAEGTDRNGWELDMVTWPCDLPTWVRECLGRPSPNERASAALAPRLPNVRVHCGVRANSSELMSLFEAADVFCLPTMADGSSIASLEAMATGLPVLVGAVGGIPELIDDGVTGFLLQPGDAADLADKLGAILENATLRCRVGIAARRSSEERFNVERQLGEILTIIDREG